MTDREATQTYILAGTGDEMELRRLQLIEADFDFFCQARLRALGLAPGARCLEAGVGGGSMARWLADAVAPDGSVVGVDMSDRFFALSNRPGLQLRQGDIREVEFDEGSFDYIHARCFVMHVPDTPALLQRFLRWLAPGGWVVLSDWDFSYHHRSHGAGDLYNRLVDETVEVVARHGGNVCVSMSLPYLMHDAGFRDIDAAGAFPLVLPWNNQPEFLALSARTVQPIYDLADVPAAAFDEFERSLPESVQTGHTLISVWGRRPVS